eukprot:GHUV01023625.1.p1 GENE.GHUV01023625.1~~GHUV01023625.1.p1  ORF type:complete len:250 (+),score=41.15 GHUV01023625.1:583-1332(+)
MIPTAERAACRPSRCFLVLFVAAVLEWDQLTSLDADPANRLTKMHQHMLSLLSRNAASLCNLSTQWARASLALIDKPASQQRHATTTVVRDPSYSQVNDDDLKFFTSILGERGVVDGESALEPMNRDWMGKYVGQSKLALKPSTTEEVSQVLAYCSLRRLAVVPQGGNTGLVGGSVPVFDEIVLNMSSMNKILSFDEVSGVLVAQAGCILQTLDDYVSQRGHIMPLDLGAKGSCQIGGNLSTNAGERKH